MVLDSEVLFFFLMSPFFFVPVGGMASRSNGDDDCAAMLNVHVHFYDTVD